MRTYPLVSEKLDYKAACLAASKPNMNDGENCNQLI